LKLLEMEGLGFSRAEIVNELSVAGNVTEQAVYKDFRRREKWQPSLQQFRDVNQLYYKTLNRYEQIYRKGSYMYLNEKNPAFKAAALRIMLEATDRMYDVRLFPEIMDRLERLQEAAKGR